MEMDEVARRWLYKTAKKNYWRVAAWYDLDDLIQDGYMWWVSRVKKYPHITDPPHMMLMFQLRYIQHLHELSNKKTKQNFESTASSLMSEHNDKNPLEAASDETDTIENYISEAPEAISRVLKSLWDESNKTLRSVYRIHRDGSRETLNERFCKLAGVQGINMVEAVHSHLMVDYKPVVRKRRRARV